VSEVFGGGYANSYDLLYTDKDYEAECDVIENIIGEHGLKPTQTILDLGCGTGNHALPLARRGYDVVGVDRSQEMLAQVRIKAGQLGSAKAAFHDGDIRSLELGRKFDAVLMMFAVLGYQLNNDDVLAALRTARRHLNPGGILIFDVWYGPAVLHIRPSERARVIPVGEGQIVRFAKGTLDVARQRCTVDYQLWRMKDDRVVARVEETHEMRFFFPLELSLLLETSGFLHLRTGDFPEFNREPDENTWNVVVVAKVL
jgi:SAM-dependent methyltransferase